MARSSIIYPILHVLAFRWIRLLRAWILVAGSGGASGSGGTTMGDWMQNLNK